MLSIRLNAYKSIKLFLDQVLEKQKSSEKIALRKLEKRCVH